MNTMPGPSQFDAITASHRVRPAPDVQSEVKVKTNVYGGLLGFLLETPLGHKVFNTSSTLIYDQAAQIYPNLCCNADRFNRKRENNCSPHSALNYER